ncbi:MAG: hypothetical protein HFACDABA_02184 [Anaerolineales bacterium]|nr:hypothetical protein [Anaerolineales bacterium]
MPASRLLVRLIIRANCYVAKRSTCVYWAALTATLRTLILNLSPKGGSLLSSREGFLKTVSERFLAQFHSAGDLLNDMFTEIFYTALGHNF